MKAIRRKLKCPVCNEVHGETERRYTKDALEDDSYIMDADDILTLCLECAILYQRPAAELL